VATWNADRTPLLERAEELAAIDAALADARGGAGRCAVIEGPAGIGKSSLLGEGRAAAADAGMTVLGGRGSELERAFPFGVVRQLFERSLAHADAPERGRLLSGAAGHAGRLFGPDQPSGGAPASDDAAFALLHGLFWLTLNLAESRPVLIAIDDLQWADEASLRWLAYLVRRLDGVPVGVLATARQLPEEDPALADVLADPATTVVRPRVLSPLAATELVRADLSPDADDAFCLACHRTTGGNPLLLHELVRTLLADGAPPSAASVEVVERLAPDAVARSVRRRLAGLPGEAAALARAVAILGDGADGRQAAALAGIERRRLAPAAAALARVDLLHREPPLRFVHPVVRNAVYGGTAAHERAEEHARAAAVLAAAGAPAEQVASQVLLAPAGSVDGAVGALRDAARRAAAEGAPASAARFMGRALDEPMPDDERGALLLELAAAELSLGAATVLERLREAVGLIGDPERRALAQLELGRALYWAGHEEDGVRVLEQALAERGGEDDLQRRLQAELFANATRLHSHYEEARRRLDALVVSPDQGPGARMLLGLQAYHEAARNGSRERAVERAERALGAMGEEELAWNYIGSTYALLVADRLDEPVRYLGRLISAARTRGAVFSFAGLSMMRAIVHYGRGALQEAEADARMALDALPHRRVWFAPHAHGWLAQILVERGAVDEAAATVAAGEGLVGSGSDPFERAPLLRGRATVASARGDHRTALAAARGVGETLAAYGHFNPAFSYPSWRSLAGEAHHALGRAGEALALAREDLELTRRWGAPRPHGRALRTLGRIEGGEEGIERIRQAVGVLADSPARLEHAYALADLGAALRRGNRRAEARDRLREALELAQRLGATLLGERAHEELVAAGARPRRLVLSGVESLTPSERRVAAMAAEGLSNRDIAQGLFVTLRTVEMHLSNAFRKLGISARTQLPAALSPAPASPAHAGEGPAASHRRPPPPAGTFTR
jgi:DNA-binding CsgD family transcriptional regulator